MVVVGGLAGHECVLAGGQVEPLDETELRQDVQRAKDGGARDAGSASARLGQQILGSEVAFPAGDQGRNGASR